VATTLQLQNTINYSQAFGGFRGLNIGVNNEPALTAGNILLTTILSPPFSWNWNRSSTTFNTTAKTQDYSTAASTFGFIEKASYKIPAATITNTALTAGVATYTATNNFQAGDLVTVTGTSNGSGVYNVSNAAIASATSSLFTININNTNVASGADSGTAIVGTTSEISENFTILGTGSELGAPAKITAQTDDNAGNISFRLLPIPDRVYTVEVIFQKRIPALMTGLSSTWAPIPDHYSFIYQQGFLALMMAYWNDPRWESVNRKFVASLLGVAEGLDEKQKDIFQAGWLNMVTETQARNIQTQQGTQARGSI
jgi:hypothetical protein